MPNKKARPKVRGKKDVIDEWEICDIDRDEQQAGLARRERRWKEIQQEIESRRKLEKKALDNAERIDPVTNRDVEKVIKHQLTPIQEAWLRLDYILFNIMETKAYQFMEYQRLNDPECYKILFKKFISPNMMANVDYYIMYFASGKIAPKKATLADVIREYNRYYNIKPKFTIKHKGEEEKKL